MHRRRLPIADPCSERFDGMQPRDTGRFCDRCQTVVHDLSSMTRAEAGKFLLDHQGQQLCLRYRVGPDQALRFRPAPPRVAGPVLVAVAGLMAACTGHFEPLELDSPQDEFTCEDAAGYTVPCIEADGEVVPYLEPDAKPEQIAEPELEQMDGDEGAQLDPDDEAILGFVDVPEIEPADALPPHSIPPETTEPSDQGCDLIVWDDHEVAVAGGITVPEFNNAETRQIEREYRREQRQQRRRARRAPRRR